jgi:hypothetical protein
MAAGAGGVKAHGSESAAAVVSFARAQALNRTDEVVLGKARAALIVATSEEVMCEMSCTTAMFDGECVRMLARG